MPFIKVDAEAFNDLLGELDPADLPPNIEMPTGGFEYSDESATLDLSKLEPVARLALDSLRAMGATHFRVRYDGGYDEGFSHPEAVILVGGESVPFEAAAERLGTPAFVAQLRAATNAVPPGTHGIAVRWPDRVQGLTDERVARAVIDELAQAFACRLLGDGFGTGEYQLYGAFTADLQAGHIVDDEHAEMPDDMR